ncbi:MAG TPA: polysaccharide deacetylase family protein, partial [Gillisia sp.]|nr:polysaccharide deacetylase family protein [Gillisia sp.]
SKPSTDNPQLTTNNRRLFRPPFGKITPNQIKELKKLDYEIVMWEVISGDYNSSTSHQVCYKEVITQAKPGSILVFHDSIKASGNLKKILPQILEYYKNKGFAFEAL